MKKYTTPHNTVVLVDEKLAKMPYAQAGWKMENGMSKNMNTVVYRKMMSYDKDVFAFSSELEIKGDSVKYKFYFVPASKYSESTAAVDYSRTTSRQVMCALREMVEMYGMPADTIRKVYRALQKDEEYTTELKKS